MAQRKVLPLKSYDVAELIELDVAGAREALYSSLEWINNKTTLHQYPDLVCELWGSFKFDESIGLQGELLDYEITFDKSVIQDVLGVPSEGATYFRGWGVDFDENDIITVAFGEKWPKGIISTKRDSLTPAAKLIHTLIVNVFCPREKHHSHVLDKDLFIIYHVLKYIPIDPVDLMYQHLQQVHSNVTFGIPYGFLLTHFIQRRAANPLFLDGSPIERVEELSLGFLKDQGIYIPPYESGSDEEVSEMSQSDDTGSGSGTDDGAAEKECLPSSSNGKRKRNDQHASTSSPSI